MMPLKYESMKCKVFTWLMTEHQGRVFSSMEATVVFPEQEAPLKKVLNSLKYRQMASPDSYRQKLHSTLQAHEPLY